MKSVTEFKLIMRSSLTTLREKFENPERMLHQLIIDMEEELHTVRSSVAEAIADELQLRKQLDRARQEAADWARRAQDAAARRDEASARSALQHKIAAEDRAAALEVQHQKQANETERLRRAVDELQNRIREARQKRTLLIARLSRARSTRRINDAMGRVGCDSAFAQFEKLEGKVEREEALSEAWDCLDGRDPAADELQRQFEATEREERLSRELEELRRQVDGDSP